METTTTVATATAVVAPIVTALSFGDVLAQEFGWLYLVGGIFALNIAIVKELYDYYDFGVKTSWKEILVRAYGGFIIGILAMTLGFYYFHHDEYSIGIASAGALLGSDLLTFIIGVGRKYLRKIEKQVDEQEIEMPTGRPPKRVMATETPTEPIQPVATEQKPVHTAVVGVGAELPTIIQATKQYFSQLNPQWKTTKLPNGSDDTVTIGRYGCLLSCIGTLFQVDPKKLAYTNADCFMPSGDMLTDKLLARLGSSMRREDVAGGTLPKSVCIARTSFYANKGIPTHFMLQFEDGSIVDPAEVFPSRKMMPKYDGTINQHRYLSNHKL